MKKGLLKFERENKRQKTIFLGKICLCKMKKKVSQIFIGIFNY